MKIGCDACGRAEAAVLCCADEAALCRRCDAAVHSANKLAGRHHRVALLPSAPACSSSRDSGDGGGDDGGGTHPACDICQEKTGYFFCVEDRALLCRSCDVAVHTATPHVATHRRFLITGVRVGAAQDHVPGSDASSGAGVVVSPSSSSANGSNSVPASSGNLNIADNRWSAAAELVGGGEDDVGQQQQEQQWPWSDIFADDDVGMEQQCYTGLSEPGSSSLAG